MEYKEGINLYPQNLSHSFGMGDLISYPSQTTEQNLPAPTSVIIDYPPLIDDLYSIIHEIHHEEYEKVIKQASVSQKRRPSKSSRNLISPRPTNLPPPSTVLPPSSISIENIRKDVSNPLLIESDVKKEEEIDEQEEMRIGVHLNIQEKVKISMRSDSSSAENFDIIGVVEGKSELEGGRGYEGGGKVKVNVEMLDHKSLVGEWCFNKNYCREEGKASNTPNSQQSPSNHSSTKNLGVALPIGLEGSDVVSLAKFKLHSSPIFWRIQTSLQPHQNLVRFALQVPPFFFPLFKPLFCYIIFS